jgi:putative redox protein
MSAEAPAPDAARVVVRGSAAAFVQEVTVGSHRFLSDEPIALGGGGAGPTPYDLLLAALGSCISMTAGVYARRKAWPLDSVTVRLTHAHIHAVDCANCETREGMLDRIEVVIELTGALTEAQRTRLLEIAGRCPVHRTLRSEIDIRSRIDVSSIEPRPGI